VYFDLGLTNKIPDKAITWKITFIKKNKKTTGEPVVIAQYSATDYFDGNPLTNL